jgi:hypothetical protein
LENTNVKEDVKVKDQTSLALSLDRFKANARLPAKQSIS